MDERRVDGDGADGAAAPGLHIEVGPLSEPDGTLHVGLQMSGGLQVTIKPDPEAAARIGMQLIGEAAKVAAAREAARRAAEAVAAGHVKPLPSPSS